MFKNMGKGLREILIDGLLSDREILELESDLDQIHWVSEGCCEDTREATQVSVE